MMASWNKRLFDIFKAQVDEQATPEDLALISYHLEAFALGEQPAA